MIMNLYGTMISLPDELVEILRVEAEKQKKTTTGLIMEVLREYCKKAENTIHTPRGIAELVEAKPVTHWIETKVVLISSQEEKLLVNSGAVLQSKEDGEGILAFRVYLYDGKTFVWIDQWLKES